MHIPVHRYGRISTSPSTLHTGLSSEIEQIEQVDFKLINLNNLNFEIEKIAPFDA
jgi:hypothetical protein